MSISSSAGRSKGPAATGQKGTHRSSSASTSSGRRLAPPALRPRGDARGRPRGCKHIAIRHPSGRWSDGTISVLFVSLRALRQRDGRCRCSAWRLDRGSSGAGVPRVRHARRELVRSEHDWLEVCASMKILRIPHERTTTLRRHDGMRGSSRGSFLLGLGILLVCHWFGRPSRAADAPLVADAKAPVVTAEPVTTSSSLPSSDSVEWSVVGAAGPVIVGLASPSAGIWPPAIGLTSTAWQVDLQRRRPNERFLAGVTLEGTYDHAAGGAGQQLLGVDASSATTGTTVIGPWRRRLAPASRQPRSTMRITTEHSATTFPMS